MVFLFQFSIRKITILIFLLTHTKIWDFKIKQEVLVIWNNEWERAMSTIMGEWIHFKEYIHPL